MQGYYSSFMTKSLSGLQQAASFAASLPGIEYGLASAGVDYVAGMVENSLFSTASNITGSRIASVALSAFNRAFSLGWQTAWAPNAAAGGYVAGGAPPGDGKSLTGYS